MHELALCQGLLREVERVAAGNDASAVTRIIVAVGGLSGVEPPLLRRAFSIARMGSIAESAVLDVEEMPTVVWCDACRAESRVAPNALLCSRCGTWRVELRSGDEMLLKRIELVAAADIASVAGG